MESKLDRRLQHANREQLYLLIQDLLVRHPPLLTEVVEILDDLEHVTGAENIRGMQPFPLHLEADESYADGINNGNQDDDEATEDWDFNGDELMAFHNRQPQPILLPLDLDSYRTRITSYAERLQQGASSQQILDDLTELLEEAETRAEQHDYQSALILYGLVLDQRLSEENATLQGIFDKAIDDIMPILETLLSEASSNITFDLSSSLAPLLPTDERHRWLERLFALWLRHLDIHRIDESVTEMLLTIAWSEDVPLLRQMVQQELSQQPQPAHSNIVDFARQYRIRALEKFLKELPLA